MNSDFSMTSNCPGVENAKYTADLRIVHVVTRFLRAGSEENTMASCNYQRECGHTVYPIHGEEYDADYASTLNPGIQCIAVPELVHAFNPVGDLRGLWALKRAYQRIQPDAAFETC